MSEPNYESQSAQCLAEVIRLVDAQFGEGYARNNPTLTGVIVAASISATSTQMAAESIRALVEQLTYNQLFPKG